MIYSGNAYTLVYSFLRLIHHLYRHEMMKPSNEEDLSSILVDFAPPSNIISHLTLPPSNFCSESVVIIYLKFFLKLKFARFLLIAPEHKVLI